MPLPDTHKDAALAMLVLAEELAYLITDSDGNILFTSPEAAGYGISQRGNLAQGPEWLAALGPRLAKLFDRPALFSHSALGQDRQPIVIQAQAMPLAGVPRLMILLRRTASAALKNLAPYHADTGLYSAPFIENKIDEELERMKRFPSVFSLLAIDISPAPHPIAPLGDLLRIHFRAVDIVGHAPIQGFLALLPGATADQARLAGGRLATLLEDFRVMLPVPIGVRYTATEAVATDTRATLLERLSCEAESTLS